MTDTNVVVYGKEINELFVSVVSQHLNPWSPWISLGNIKKRKKFDITREKVVKADSPVPVGPMSLREFSSV